MSSTFKGDFPDSDTRFAEALEELTQSIETGTALEDVRVYKRPNVDVAALRKGYGMTQQQFADAFGITIGTLRNWEQGRRIPDGPAQRLLEIIEDRPEVAIEVLGGNLSREGGLSPEDIRERAAEVRRRGLEARAARNRPEMEGPAKDAEPGRSGLFAINKLIHRKAGPAPPKADNDVPKTPGQRLAARHNKGVLEVVRVDVHVGQRVRQARWMVGMTQSQLGSSVGIRFQHIQKYETGANRIDAGRLWDIAAVLNVPVSFFYDGLFLNLEGQLPPDARESSGDILTDEKALKLLRAYYSIPEGKRRRLFDLARALGNAA